MAAFPENMRLPSHLEMIFKIPKWHLVNHVLKCLVPFSLTYTEGAGRTDGEAPERCWAWLNSIARCASMMTAGMRWDTMDDFANAWNYKMLNLESTLVKKMVKAIPLAVVNVRVYHAFTEALKVNHASELDAWLEQVVNWENGASEFCPYEVREPIWPQVKKQLAEEEQRREEKGEWVVMSSLIMEGVDLEEAHLSWEKKPDYSPGESRPGEANGPALTYTQAPKSYETSTPETMQLFLPSSLPTQERYLICPPELIDAEDQLRWGQCFDTLARLRIQLQARTVAYKDMSRMTPSQGLWTRLDTLRHQIETKIKALVVTYRASRKALKAIRGEGEWSDVLRELKDGDIRGITERVLKEKEKEDWEWAQRVAGVKEDAIDGDRANITSLGYGLRSEWCKARANSRRPREELRLVEEEMCRAIQYCHFQAGWWTQQIGRREGLSPWLSEGLKAYAKEQSKIEVSRAVRWEERWAPVRVRGKEILKYVSDASFSRDISSLASLEIELDLGNDYDDDELGTTLYNDDDLDV
ncbi:hypothetical protein V5O48_016945 [Marasmius crinis-equi]|uniref:Uncharacterized protein n=1 Tax=Marasmius crinis-equi TaxID=585013 RepID=A0ABR3EQC2_9AGAR